MNELADRWARLTTIATLAVLPIWPLAYVIIDSRWPDQSFLVKALVATVAMVIVARHPRRAVPPLDSVAEPVGRRRRAYQDGDARARRRSWSGRRGCGSRRAFLLSPIVWLVVFGIIGGIFYLWLKWSSWLIDRSAGCSATHPGSSLRTRSSS